MYKYVEIKQHILEQSMGKTWNPEVYYWIISKNLQEEVIIKIDGGISAESYLFNTQYLSNDNKLYCLGYIWENKDMESFEENLNPSVVALEFNELFSKVRWQI